MKKRAMVTIALTGYFSMGGVSYAQTQVIKDETIVASIESGDCFPDVAGLRNSENFVIVYPTGSGESYDAMFKIYNMDGEVVIADRLIENNIISAELIYGVGTASNNTKFSCVYSQTIEWPLSYTYSEQFLHSGSQTGYKQLLDDLPSSSADGTFRVTMPNQNQDTHFASENRVEYYGIHYTDLDATSCGYPLTPVTLGIGGYDQIDPEDIYGENDAFDTDATSLESYWQTSTYQWILYTWTREEQAGYNYVFARPARYNGVIQMQRWMGDPVQLSSVHVGPQAQSWTDVDLTEDNHFLVVWNQLADNPGIHICKLDYQGNVLSGYPKRIVPLSTGTQTRYPSIVTFQTDGVVKYVVSWEQYFPGGLEHRGSPCAGE